MIIIFRKRKINYMVRYIIVCDHDLEWAGKFRAEFARSDICIRNIELLEDAINEDNIRRLKEHEICAVICSQYIIDEYISEYGREVLYNIISGMNFNIFIIADTYSYNDEVRMLKAGCIDYQCRSVPIEIIALRVKNIIMREFPDRVLYEDKKAGVIYAGDDMLKLTKKEKEVLSYLLVHRGEIVSKTILMEELWDITDIDKSRVADTIIKQLRKKLKGYAAEIITYYGRGVLLKLR